MIIKNAFITPIFCFDIYSKELNDSLREDAYFQKENNNGRTISNVGGFQSNHIYDTKAVKNFIETVTPCVEKVKNTIQYNFDLTLDGLWYNINKKNDLNKSHCHGGAILAAAYYIDTPNNCGDIVFENIDKHVTMNSNIIVNKNNLFNSNYHVHPKQGLLVIFYAWINHFVEPNLSEKDRLSLSFNIT
jgi:hypothetical protein